MKAPRWVQKKVILAIHEEMLSDYGGISGIRDEGLLDSAISRAENLFLYGKPSLFDLAAAYAFGIAKNHPFLDGNKRTAFLTAYIFLERNGWILSAPEAEATIQTLALASSQISERDFSEWLSKSCEPARK